MEQYTPDEIEVFVESVEALSEKYSVSDKAILRVIATEVSSFEELRGLDFRDLDAIVQEGLASIGR